MLLACALGCGGPEFTSAALDASTAADAPEPSDGAAEATGITDAMAGDVADGSTSTDAQDGATVPPAHCGVGFHCVPEVPTGWTGPVELGTVGASQTAPACDLGFLGGKTDGWEGLTAPPATCTCSCGAQQVTCGSIALTFNATMVCSSAAGCYTGPAMPAGSCVTLKGSCLATGAGPYASTPAEIPVSATCPAVPGVTKPATSWTSAVRACDSSVERVASDCTGGDICAPQPGSSFGPSVCIEQMGDVACPTSGYVNKTLFFQSVDDTRGCSACTCTASGQQCASAGVLEYSTSDGSCGGTPDTFGAPFSCDPVSDDVDVKYTVTPTPGKCTANSVSAQGTAAAAGPITACCL